MIIRKENMMSEIYINIKESLLKGFNALRRSHFTNYRKQMGYCSPSATLIKPLIIKGAKNVYMYENTGVKDALIMAPKAKFVMKKHSGAAEGLTVITGNHERRIGRFYRTITEQEKLLLDEDVIVEEDCWIGTRVTLSYGCYSSKRYNRCCWCCSFKINCTLFCGRWSPSETH